MKQLKRKPAILLMALMIVINTLRPVLAAENIPVIDLGTFEMTEGKGQREEHMQVQSFSRQNGVTVTSVNEAYTYEGKIIEPVPVVSISKNILTRDKDYSLTYLGNEGPGRAYIVIGGIYPYIGNVYQSFKILDNDISRAKVSYTLKAHYEGKPVELDIRCICEGESGRVIPECCYEVEYFDNDRPGNARAVIRGKNGYKGEQTIDYAVTGVYIAQISENSTLITQKRTVVPTKTKWYIKPDFNVVRVRTTDGRVVGVSKVKDKLRSKKKEPWYYARIQAKKAGIERIILDGANGERADYIIYSEAPVLVKKALKVNDVITLSMNDYISGTRYLKPVSITSKKTEVATVSDDNLINVLANGSSRITAFYPGRKINATLIAKLPAFTAAKITLKKRPKRLRLKNLPKGAIVKYFSSDVNIVKVNDEGFVAPVANGSAVISAKTGNVTAKCTVTVKGLK